MTLRIDHLRVTDLIVQSLQPLMADSAATFDAAKARDAIEPRYGLWLAVGLLGVLIAANVDAFGRVANQRPAAAS